MRGTTTPAHHPDLIVTDDPDFIIGAASPVRGEPMSAQVIRHQEERIRELERELAEERRKRQAHDG